jgi:hypothetical protein
MFLSPPLPSSLKSIIKIFLKENYDEILVQPGREK